MRRKSLLTAFMLPVLLATSACGTMTDDPNARSSGAAQAVIEASSGVHDKSSDEIGTSQRAAAEKAEAAAARKAKEAAEAGQAAAAAGQKAAAAAQKEAAEAQASKSASATSPAAPAPAVDAAAKAAPKSAPVLPTSSAERIVTTASTRAYTWHDNTPGDSDVRSDPPRNKAGRATGTYADPIGITAGHFKASAHAGTDVQAGTRIYLPDVRRYLIVEDTCGDGNDPQAGPCRPDNNTNATIWIDMVIGSRSMSAEGADDCAAKVTDVQTAVLNPASNYAVAPGAGVIHDGICDAGYGNTLVRQ